MTAFLDAFWPNLAATLFGIVVGIPIALIINRSLLEHQRKLESDQATRRLEDAITVLVGACQYNIRILDSIREEALVGRVMHSPDLRLTTWDAVGDIVTSGGVDPELLQILSHHWLRLHRIQALSDEIFTREVTGGLSAIEDKQVVQQFWQTLHDSAFTLAAHASEAILRLDALKVRNDMPTNVSVRR